MSSYSTEYMVTGLHLTSYSTEYVVTGLPLRSYSTEYVDIGPPKCTNPTGYLIFSLLTCTYQKKYEEVGDLSPRIKKNNMLCDSLTPHPRKKKSCIYLTVPLNCNIQRHKTPQLFSRKRILTQYVKLSFNTNRESPLYGRK